MATKKKKAQRQASAKSRGPALAKERKARANRRQAAAVAAVMGDAGWRAAIDDVLASMTLRQASLGRLDPKCPEVSTEDLATAVKHPKVLEGALEVFLDNTCGDTRRCHCKHFALAAAISEEAERHTDRDFDDLYKEITTGLDRFLDLREAGKGAN